MADTRITVTFDGEKLAAIRQFIGKDAQNIEAALQEQLEKLYAKTVPAPVRQYIDGKTKPMPTPKPKDRTKPDATHNTNV